MCCACRVRHAACRACRCACMIRRTCMPMLAQPTTSPHAQQDWTPEYRPHSIVPPTTIKGDRLRKTFMVSEPMILKVGGCAFCDCAIMNVKGGRASAPDQRPCSHAGLTSSGAHAALLHACSRHAPQNCPSHAASRQPERARGPQDQDRLHPGPRLLV